MTDVPAASSRKRIFAWQMYDWADSAFATVIMATILPSFFKIVYSLRFPDSGNGSSTSVWGAANSVSMLLVAIVALVLGPAADRLSRKKRILAWFMLLGALTTAVIGFIPLHLWWVFPILYVLANLGFAGGNIFYDALLPAVAPPGKLDQVSSGGYALGYFGGGLLLALCIGLIVLLPKQNLTGASTPLPILAMQVSFVLTGIWWAVFSLPLFRHVPEPPAIAPQGAQRAALFSLHQMAQTVADVLRHKEMFKFLIAFWFYSDGVGTIIKMAVIFGHEALDKLGVDLTPHLTATLLLAQFAGVPFTLMWARIARRIGTKQAVLACLAIYAGICLLGYFLSQIWHFYALGFLVALVQGGTQALSRSLFAVLVPKGREAEFFGFYNISGKFAGIVGPLLFPMLAAFGLPSRVAIFALIGFFGFGALVLWTVKVPAEK